MLLAEIREQGSSNENAAPRAVSCPKFFPCWSSPPPVVYNDFPALCILYILRESDTCQTKWQDYTPDLQWPPPSLWPRPSAVFPSPHQSEPSQQRRQRNQFRNYRKPPRFTPTDHPNGTSRLTPVSTVALRSDSVTRSPRDATQARHDEAGSPTCAERRLRARLWASRCLSRSLVAHCDQSTRLRVWTTTCCLIGQHASRSSVLSDGTFDTRLCRPQRLRRNSQSNARPLAFLNPLQWANGCGTTGWKSGTKSKTWTLTQ